jgi:signal transduction histidine kinase
LQHRLDAVEKRAGVEARVVAEGLVELPPSVEEGLYRIAQEALNNSLKHAAASLVTVRIEGGDDMVELEVTDNGRGFDPDSLQDGGGMGLPNMRERAERLGGSLAILSEPETGATVKASIPTRRSWSRPILPIERLNEVL